MSLLSRYLKLNETHGILICPAHECVVLPNSVKKHFDKHHSRDLTHAERRQLQEEADELSASVSLKTEYSQFRYAQEDGSPLHEIPYLRLHSCLACKICKHICTKKSAEKIMKEHLRKQHTIYSNPGLQSMSGRSQYVQSTFCQRYFIGATGNAGGLNVLRYFEVIPSNTTDRNTDSSTDCDEPERDLSTNSVTPTIQRAESLHPSKATSDSTAFQRLQAQLGRAAAWACEEGEARLATVSHNESVEINPWLAYTRFLEILPEKWEDALRYMEIPDCGREPALYYLYCTTKSMVRTWQNSTAKTSRYARIRVMQEDINDVPLLPLETYQYLSLQHALPLQKMFVFFYRVLVDGQPRPHQLQLSPPQEDAWNHIIEHVHNVDGDYPTVETSHTRTHLDPLERLCHAFWLSLVEQTCIHDDFELAFVVSTAYLVMSRQSKGVRQGYNFATDIAALKKMVRLSSVQKFREQFIHRAHDPNSKDDAITHLEAICLMGEQTSVAQKAPNQEEAHRSAADNFKAWVYDYLTTEYPTPMNWLIHTARYLSRFRYGENLDAFVHWKGDTVTVRGIRTTLSKYTSLVHNECEAASSLLCKLAFVSQRSALPLIPWDDLIEDPANRTPGFSIFSPKTPLLSSQAGFVQEQLLCAHKQGREVLIDDLKNPRQIQHYCDLVEAFTTTLLGLVHFTSGQPARGTELLSIHHENPRNGMLRNIFLYKGLVAVVPQYHKGYNRDKSLKVVYRFLPRPVGSLLVWYLWLIRPFYALIQHQAPESIQAVHVSRATSTLLWSDANGTQYTTSKLLRQVVQRATEKWMGQSITLSILRHLLIAFGRKMSGMDRIPTELSKEEVDEIVDAAEAEEREMQSGHSAATASAVYALDISQVFTKKFDRAGGQFKVSTKWHKELGFDVQEAFDERYPATEPPRASRDLADRIQCNYIRLLKENFGKQATFRPQQENVVRAIMGGETVVVYIAGTGAGKSLTFLLPACYPGYGQTIVIVPLAALRHDIVAHCHKHRLRTTVWKDGQCDQSATIILATPECLGQSSFMDMAHRLSSTGHLERIVVDEFHYVLLPDHSYRPHLLELRQLTRFGVRLTLLSATIPVQEQVNAFRLLGVPTDTVPFRVSTSRPNLAWQVHTLSLSSHENVSDMADYIQSQLAHFPKILVYVDLTTTAELLSVELQCHKYHGQMTVEERKAQHEAFSACTAGVLVATSAFLVGVHVANIRAVLFLGLPDSLYSVVQGGGRGGRDGCPCVVRIVLSTQIPNTHYSKAEPGHKAMVDAFVQQGTRQAICRRRVLCMYFDGDVERLHCRTHEQPCDVCETSPFQPRQGDHEHTPLPLAASCLDQHSTVPPPVPVSTPVRHVVPASLPPLATPGTEPRPLASSPTEYALSEPRRLYGGPSVSDVIDSTGSPCVPRRSLYREVMPAPGSGTRPAPSRSLLSSKERPATWSSASTVLAPRGVPDPGEGSPCSSRLGASEPLATDFIRARQDRELEFNAETLGDAHAARSDLFRQQLPATQRFWIAHCIVCFCDRDDYKHPRAECSKFIGALVTQYRRKMKQGWGRGMCWQCLMPVNCCPKWNLSGTGPILHRPDSQEECVDKRAILDTWVCLWDKCGGARARWVQRIQTTRAGLDPTKDHDIRQYFQEMVLFGDDYKASRLCLDVNWFTQTFFLHGRSPTALLSPQQGAH